MVCRDLLDPVPIPVPGTSRGLGDGVVRGRLRDAVGGVPLARQPPIRTPRGEAAPPCEAKPLSGPRPLFLGGLEDCGGRGLGLRAVFLGLVWLLVAG